MVVARFVILTNSQSRYISRVRYTFSVTFVESSFPSLRVIIDAVDDYEREVGNIRCDSVHSCYVTKRTPDDGIYTISSGMHFTCTEDLTKLENLS